MYYLTKIVKNHMRPIIKLGLALMLTLAFCGCGKAENAEKLKTESDFTKKSCPIYYYNLDNRYNIDLYFKDSVDDMPYINVVDGISLLSDFTKYSYSYQKTGSKMKVSRSDNEYYTVFDFSKGCIEFLDYNCFFNPNDSMPILVPNSNLEKSDLFYLDESSVVNVYGNVISIDLKEYGIPYYMRGDNMYIPLQTFTDIYLSPLNIIVNYNGGEVFALRASDYRGEGGLSDIAKRYYSYDAGLRSEELTEYNYKELCLCLDINYGLKKEHNIDKFETLFQNAGFDYEMNQIDAAYEARVLEALVSGVFGDSHSRYMYPSCYLSSGYVMNNGTSVSKSITDYSSNIQYYTRARKDAYLTGCPFYEEVGNTAYVTLDEFSIDFKKDYYADGIESDPSDTVGMIIYANSRINREDSPIENVVLDLSNNTGGDIEAAVYTLAWCMGDAPLYLTDTFTNASTTATYRADVNLDHEFDDKDQLEGKNIYCLISPCSFSCGNMVPAVLKSTGRVSILGARSGGGASIISYISTADGNVLQISSTKIISTLKNGAYYSVDEGVEPDYRIDKVEDFYDRSALTQYINSLY